MKTLTITLETIDTAVFANADVKVANAALIAAIGAVSPVITEFAVGRRTGAAKLWAFHFGRNKTWATLTNADGKAYASLNAWIRGNFKIDAKATVLFDQYQNAMGYLAREGAKLAAGVESPEVKAKRTAVEMMQAAYGTHFAKALTEDAVAMRTLLRQMQRDCTKALKATPAVETVATVTVAA